MPQAEGDLGEDGKHLGRRGFELQPGDRHEAPNVLVARRRNVEDTRFHHESAPNLGGTRVATRE
jgi:hypothetical protein